MNAPVKDRTFEVVIVAPGEVLAGIEENSHALEIAHGYSAIQSANEAATVTALLRDTKTSITRLEEWKTRMIAPAKAILDNAAALFNPAINARKAAEVVYKKLLTDWTERERQREARERIERQEAERKAAEEARAKEAQAAEQRRRAEEARASGNARSAAALERAAATSETQAQFAKLAPTLPPVQEASRVEGFTTRENWVPELPEGKTDEDAVIEICRAVAGGRVDLVSCLELDWAYLRKKAKLEKAKFAVPGLVGKDRPIPVSR